MKRMWINQPSKLQPYHNLHGTNVLVIHEGGDTYRAYFLNGDIIDQQIHQAALSPGWVGV